MFIHKSSILEKNVEIGQNTKIWHWCHISEGVKIGKNCILGQNIFIGKNVSIGNNVKIQNNVSLYDNVELEEGVFCGPSCVFTNVYNPRSSIERKNEYMDTLVKRGSTLGANCTIVCGVVLGECCFIGAGAVVVSDVKPYALVVGNPGKQIGWMSEFGERMFFEKETVYSCKHTGMIYEYDGENVFKRF